MSHAHLRCTACKTIFRPEDAGHIERRELVDNLYDRPRTLEARVIDVCPECSSESIKPFHACDICEEVAALPGGDLCGPCEALIDAPDRHGTLLAAIVEIARAGAVGAR